MDLKILYEDNHLIAVYKPAGVLVQADKTGDATLLDEVKYYLKTKHNKLGNVFLGLIHRLDRPVSGVILFAKTSKGASRLSEQFRAHTVDKIYHALVVGSFKDQHGSLIHFLSKDKDVNKVTVYDKEQPDTQRAELEYTVVKSGKQYTLLQIKLGTGRAHQIRSQLAFIGHPIVGDVKYGAPAPLPDKSLALCATSLTFQTATGDEMKTAEVAVPEEWVAKVI